MLLSYHWRVKIWGNSLIKLFKKFLICLCVYQLSDFFHSIFYILCPIYTWGLWRLNCIEMDYITSCINSFNVNSSFNVKRMKSSCISSKLHIWRKQMKLEKSKKNYYHRLALSFHFWQWGLVSCRHEIDCTGLSRVWKDAPL